MIFTLQLHSYILDICSDNFTVEMETSKYVAEAAQDVGVPARGSFKSATTLVPQTLEKAVTIGPLSNPCSR